jgi:hypothetical protein
MKIIYMEPTIILIAQQNQEFAQKLVQSGQIKQVNGLNYLVIEQNEEE